MGGVRARLLEGLVSWAAAAAHSMMMTSDGIKVSRDFIGTVLSDWEPDVEAKVRAQRENLRH